jgi:serine/threonine-protein kinase
MKTSLPVSLIVSKGPEMVAVPNVIGMRLVNAEVALTNESLKVGNITELHHATIAKDYVIDQNPRADIIAVRKDSPINLVVSLGPEPVAVTVPDLVGMYLAAAERALADRGLTVGRVIEDPNSPYAHGIVVRQSPGIGASVTEGLRVDLTVSMRPDIVVSEPLQLRSIRIDVPSSGSVSQQVRIDLLDVNRYRTIYTGTWQRGDSFDLDIEWVGDKALIKIYFNGVYRESREVT